VKIIGREEVERSLDFPSLIDALRAAFAGSTDTPRRSVHRISGGDSPDAFALLPAWNHEHIGVKAFTYLPGNAAQGRPVLHSQILMFDRRTGVPMALVDGTSTTCWRTAAVAALAADYLARRDAKRLLFCGTGPLAPYMILAHSTVRSYESVGVWGRDRQKIERTVAAVQAVRPDFAGTVVDDLERAARSADVISCATGAREPLIRGDWIQPGTHTDFFGNHERNARECDSDLVAAARVYVDSRANVLNEAGEILIPMAEGRIDESHIVGELADLCSGRVAGRQRAHDVTLFKSVGTALADLVAAGVMLHRA